MTVQRKRTWEIAREKIKQIAIHNSFQSWLGNQIFVTSQRAQLQYMADTPPRWAKAFTPVFLATASSSCPALVHEAANRGLNWNCLCWGGDELRKASPWKISTTQDARCKKKRSRAEPAEAAKVLENQISASRGSRDRREAVDALTQNISKAELSEDYSGAAALPPSLPLSAALGSPPALSAGWMSDAWQKKTVYMPKDIFHEHCSNQPVARGP